VTDDASHREETKRGLLRALLLQVDEEIATMTRAHDDARRAATHEEARPENDKDTRALEASYLAAGQAARVAELQLASKVLGGLELRVLPEGAAASATAVVTVEDDDGTRTTFFLVPHGGGAKLALGGQTVHALTPQSPMGKAVLGRTVGESFELRTKAGARELAIVEIW